MAGYAVLTIAGLFLASALYAFELLSEGAMDSVSAVSAQSVEDIINIAGSPAAGLTEDDDYESLPFQTRITVGEGDTDEVQTELDFKLTQEVEAWVQELRVQQGLPQLEVGYVEELSPSSFDTNPFLFESSQILDFSPDGDGDDEDRVIFQQGRIRQQVELLESGVDSITTRFERYVESAATINANPDNELSSIGSGFVTNSRSTSTQTYSNYRDEDRPLF